MQPKSQFSSGYSSHKASAPRSPVAQFEELDCSTHATQPRNYSTQTLNSGYATKKLIWFMQNRAKCTSRGKSGEIKNEYSLRKRLHMSWVPSSTKKMTTSKRRYTREIRHQRKEQRVKKGSGPQRGHPVLQNSLRRGTPLPPRR